MRAWQVGDVMTTDVATVGAQTPYREIIDVVTGRHVSAVPVVDDFDRVVGVVSQADLLHKVELVGEPHERRLFESRRRRDARVKADGAVATELMTAPAITTYARTPVAAAAKLMDREHVKRLPVVDDLGRLVGIVTRGDLLRVHLRPDADIRRDVVREVLQRVLAVREGVVRVTVDDGVVRMVGQLDRRTSVDIAGQLAAQVSGVVELANELGYDYDDTVSPIGPRHRMMGDVPA
ncbi:CBS domain-containing protein [Micromonospora sp. NBC_01796]|uniref:CBS domain-containing protein n=1 Tax=Micromonospora sp. NBC_01796 TaxID=2975987 RepID=UPI002DDBEC05|nr:CBS domain-containing protein [Micromonospora sp. NBC_01796]WSA84145.1 CBS domain-containing protein [Micromonospora sp. NBC_01796]